MNVALTLPVLPATNVTACALVLMRTEKGIAYDLAGVGTPFSNEVEVRRIEFVACGEFVWIHETGLAWDVFPRDEARARYKQLVSSGYVKADAKVEVIGQCEAPTTRGEFSWGEGANRYATVEIPAQTCPAIREVYWHGGRKVSTRVMRAFTFTTPDKWTSLRIKSNDVDTTTSTSRLFVDAG